MHHPERSYGWELSRRKSPGPNAAQQANCVRVRTTDRRSWTGKDVWRQTDRCEIRPSHAASKSGLASFFSGPALTFGNGPRSGFSLDDFFFLPPSRYLARGGGSTGVVGCCQPRSPLVTALSHATDRAVPQQARRLSVTMLAFAPPGFRARTTPGSQGPGGWARAADITFYAESFPCGDH